MSGSKRNKKSETRVSNIERISILEDIGLRACIVAYILYHFSLPK